MLYLYLPTSVGSSKAEGKKTEYGIVAYQKNQKVAFVPNVSPNLLFIICLCLRFNILRLSPIHLANVLEDML